MTLQDHPDNHLEILTVVWVPFQHPVRNIFTLNDSWFRSRRKPAAGIYGKPVNAITGPISDAFCLAIIFTDRCLKFTVFNSVGTIR